jgi:hypothetical protein
MSMIEPRGHRSLAPGHFMGIAAIGIVGGIVALVLFLSVVGFLFRLFEIVVVILLVGLLVRWLVSRALR